MQAFQGIIGIFFILGLAFLLSNNKKRINFRLVISGILLQLFIAILILKVPPVTRFFQTLGHGMEKIEQFARKGAEFVYGGLITSNGVYNPKVYKIDTINTGNSTRYIEYIVDDPSGKYPTVFTPKNTELTSYKLLEINDKGDITSSINVNYTNGGFERQGDFRRSGFIFAFNVTATIILVCVLVAILYHFGIMQRVVSVIAKAMNFIMRVSGAEALSNVASAFVGQVEAQVMIRPYLASMTKSEILASMSGSLACIAGGILIVYVNMGAKAEYLLAASLMAAPAALVISKIIYPETEESQTMGDVKLEVKSPYSNVIDAISHGASDGMKISVNVIAMLIGFIGLIALLNYILGGIGHLFNPNFNLSLDYIFSKIFYPFAWVMGVPAKDVNEVATLLGKKLTINEFVAFQDLTTRLKGVLGEKANLIVQFAICGFANFSSVGMQIGGIGELAPTRRTDLAQLGMRALICGTLASYLSATIAGLLYHV